MKHNFFDLKYNCRFEIIAADVNNESRFEL